jgi:hypothetical protein
MKLHHVTRSVIAAVTFVVALGVVPATAPIGSIGSIDTAAPAAAAGSHTLGTGPINDILAWADAKKACGLTRDQLAAMMLTPVYFEVGDPTNQSPSPMTLSRYDTSSGLYAFSQPGSFNKAFFHPGIGLWQFDSAGGWPLTASTAINTYTSASQAATVMSSRWCNATGTDAAKRAYAWGPWLECTGGQTGVGSCEAMYASILLSGVFTVNADPSVSSLGGMEQRTCNVAGIGQVACSYVDPSRAQGNKAFTAPGYGPSPLTAPFYVYDFNGREYRHWLSIDTGYPGTIEADKPITSNARTSLTWRNNQSTLCDVTANRGDNCLSADLRPWSTVFTFGGSSFGEVGVGTNADGRQEIFVVGTDGQLWHSWQNNPNGFWSDWQPLGGSFPLTSTPAVGRNQDGRLEMFVRGTDGALWHQYQVAPNSYWSGWGSMGGQLSADPSVVTNADGRLQLFARWASGAAATTTQSSPNMAFGAWSQFGGAWPDGSVLTPVNNADGRVEIFATANDGQVWHAWQTTPGGAFSGFFPIGGSLPTARRVGVARNADGRIEVFATSSDGTLWHDWQVAPNSGWSNFASLGGGWSTAPDVLRDQSGRLDLVAIGSNGQLGMTVQNTPGSFFIPVQFLGGSGGRRPELGVNGDGHVEAFYPGGDNVIDHAWQLSPP